MLCLTRIATLPHLAAAAAEEALQKSTFAVLRRKIFDALRHQQNPNVPLATPALNAFSFSGLYLWGFLVLSRSELKVQQRPAIELVM